MTLKKANETLAKLNASFPLMNMKAVDGGDRSYVSATARFLVIDAEKLTELKKVIGAHTITFGRSGANFRMIIQ